MNYVLDYADSLLIVTNVPSRIELDATIPENGTLTGINCVFSIGENDPEDYGNEQPFPFEVVDFPLLSSYGRSACQYDECHSLANGLDFNSAVYCDEHAGPVREEYADVDVIWNGAVDETEFNVTDREVYLRIIDSVSESIRTGNEGSPPTIIAEDEHGSIVDVTISASFHNHEFDTREEYDKYLDVSGCFCESYETTQFYADGSTV